MATTLSQRLKEVLAGWPRGTQTELANVVGVSTSAVSQWLKGETKSLSSENLLKVAKFLNVTPEWLLEGKGRPMLKEPATEELREGPAIKGMVPLLTSVQAGQWSDVVEDDVNEWLPCPVNHGPSTFCLVVEGESMSNPGGKPSYEPGDVIFVDPDASPKPGDCVVARLDDQKQATFKQYREEDGRVMLKALNPEWKPRYIDITTDATICGVVIGKWVSA